MYIFSFKTANQMQHKSWGKSWAVSKIKDPVFSYQQLFIPQSATNSRNYSLTESTPPVLQLYSSWSKIVNLLLLDFCRSNREIIDLEFFVTATPVKYHIILKFYCCFSKFKYFYLEIVIFEYFLWGTDMIDVICPLEY